MHVLPQQVTYRNILRVLLAGFGLVILLLLAAGFGGLNNIRSIQRSAATLVDELQDTADLVDEIQSEQEALSAAFYNLARGPNSVDRVKILAVLDTADKNVGEIADETEGTSDEAMGKALKQATEAFTTEARRLLARENPPTLLSRDLFQRHRQVTSVVAKLIQSGRQKSQAAQSSITAQSRQLFTQTFVLLGGCLALALIFSLLTVRMTTGLFRKMEWQTSELSRVSWHMLENQESTARRFSHELHDELGQALTALKANIMSLGKEASEARLKDCIELVGGALRNVRELSQLLRPTILDDFGLDASLRWLTEKFAERTGVEVDYHSDFSGRLPDETETHLFRIAQEALTNVARHSSAKRVQMTLRANQSSIQLSIADNGVGLAKRDPITEGGMGMIGMRARARSAGGELVVLSQPGEGVSVKVQVPKRVLSNAEEDTHPAGR
jgi:signal transduction histidine kinase